MIKKNLSQRMLTLVISINFLFFFGCASTKFNEKQPIFIEAKKEEKKKELPKLIPVPVPMPIPGQARPAPAAEAITKERGNAAIEESKKKKVWEMLDEATEKARRQPIEEGFFNAIQLYDYSAGAIYQVYTAQDRVTGIEFLPGEKVISIALGDTVRWILGQTTSANNIEIVLIKPIRSGLKTNAIITTTQRLYNLEIKSYNNTYMSMVKWQIPQLLITNGPEAEELTKKDQKEKTEKKSIEEKTGMNLKNLDFNYEFVELSSPLPKWLPKQIWTDGRQTFLVFPKSIKESEWPVVFALTNNGKDSVVNYRVQENVMIIDRVVEKGILKLGKESSIGFERNIND